MVQERLALAKAQEEADTNLATAQGDTVSISEEAKALHVLNLVEKANEAETESDTFTENDSTMIKELKEKIEKLQQEISEIEEGNLPEKTKEKLVQERQTELMELARQLSRLLSDGGSGYYGGTRAEGFGGSAASF